MFWFIPLRIYNYRGGNEPTPKVRLKSNDCAVGFFITIGSIC